MQHIALKTNCLEATRAFYAEVLGLPKVQANLETGHIWVNLAEGFVLRFRPHGRSPRPFGAGVLGP